MTEYSMKSYAIVSRGRAGEGLKLALWRGPEDYVASLGKQKYSDLKTI